MGDASVWRVCRMKYVGEKGCKLNNAPIVYQQCASIFPNSYYCGFRLERRRNTRKFRTSNSNGNEQALPQYDPRIPWLLGPGYSSDNIFHYKTTFTWDGFSGITIPADELPIRC
jgi:hypothetical protein